MNTPPPTGGPNPAPDTQDRAEEKPDFLPTRIFSAEQVSADEPSLGFDFSDPADPNATNAHFASPVRPGEGPFVPTVPGYEIIDVLGRGGMGIVYKARQIGLNRIVALKMVVSGRYAEQDDLERFGREAEAIAKLVHPCVVQIFEIGQSNGMPYFSMEFCSGGSLASRLRGTPIDPKLTAKLIQQVAWGIHAAHRLNIIHRDLKPGNILLQVVDGGLRRVESTRANGELQLVNLADATALTARSKSMKPLRDNKPSPLPESAVPKITDFGLAKQLDESGPQTKSGWILGTPSYMAPEQAKCAYDQLGPATDVYALGTILYEMLTGRPPFKAANDIDTIRQVIGVEPIPPSRLEPKIPRDLETICLKCLEKDPRKRYTSAEDLADDLARFRKGEPIQGRLPGTLERTLRWMRRRPTTAAVMGLIALGFVILLGTWITFTARLQFANDELQREQAATLLHSKNADSARERAEGELDRAERILYAHRLVLADREAERGNHRHALDLLDDCRWEYRGWEWRYLHWRCTGALDHPIRDASRCLHGNASPILTMVSSSDGTRMVTGSRNGEIIVWDMNTREIVHQFPTHLQGLMTIAFHDKTQTVATAGRDKTVKLWDLSTGVERMTLTGHKANVEGLAFRSDGRALVTFDRIDVRLWDLSSRGELWKVNVGAQTSNGPLAMSADDKWIIHPDDREHVVLRDASTGNLEQTLAGHGRHVSALAFHPDNDRFISGSEDGSIRLWSRKQQGTITTLDAHRQTVNDVSFNRDGSRIVSAGQDHAVYVWDTETGQELIALKGSQESVEQVAFGTDDVTLAVLNRSGKMRLFEARPQRGELSFRAESVVSSINYHPDGDRIVTGSADGVIQLWDAETGRQVMRLVEHRYPVTSVNFISRGTPELVTTLGDPVEAIRQVREGEFLLKRWDLITGKPKLNVFAHQYSITRSAVSPNGKLIATTSLDGTCCIWDAQHGGLIRALKVSLPLIDTAFHPTLPVLAIACVDKKIRLFEYETGKVLAPLEGHTNPVISLEFSRDGTQLLSAASELDLKKQGKGIPGEVIVWDWENRAERFRLEGLRDAVFQTRFNPQGTIIGTVGGKLIEFDQGGGELKLWNAANGELIRDYAEQNGVAFGIAFSPNGKRFVVGGADRVVHVWDIPPEFVPPE